MTKYIDPRHFTPPYVVDVRNEVEPDDGYYSDEDYLSNRQFKEPDEDIIGEEASAVEVPTSFDVIGQYVRALPDGTFVVDVEVEVPDIDGVVDFEIRTAVQP